MNDEDERGYASVPTPADYDPEGTQIASTPGGGVLVRLPEITHLDVEPWAVDIGLTLERLVQLRDTIDNHLRGAAGVNDDNFRGSPEVSQRADQASSVTAEEGEGLAPALPGQIIRRADGAAGPTSHRDMPTTAEGGAEELRAIVARCQALADWLSRHSSLGVDVEADGIRRAIGDRLHAALGAPSAPAEWEQHGFPEARALARVQELANTHSSELPDALDFGGEYESGWDSAMDAIKAAIDNRHPDKPRYPITSHAYRGDGFLHPCTALGYGSMCGSTQWDHMEEQ